MIRIGIIGAGGMATERARSFQRMAHTRIIGCLSRDRSKANSLARDAGGQAYDDLPALLADADAVAICVPNHLHASMAHQALAHGRHVLVEYPLCTHPDEIAALRSAASKSGCVLMVGNTIVHEAAFRYLRKHKERLGPILSAASRVSWHNETIADRWFIKPESRGPLFAAFHYHHIEYYRHLLGEVEWVHARDESRDGPPTAGGTLMMGHSGGRTSCVQWYLSSAGFGLARGMWITGAKSSVAIISGTDGKSRVVWDGGGKNKEGIFADEWGVAGSCEDFVRAIEGKLDYVRRLDSDLLTLKIGLLASESARRGRVVKFPRSTSTCNPTGRS